MATRTNLRAWVKLASAADDAWTAYTVDANGEIDVTGLTAGETYDVSVPPDYLVRRFVADSAPAVSLTDIDVESGTGVTVNPTYGGTNLAYGLNGPSWLSINQATGQITGTAPAGDADGTYTVQVSNAAGSASAVASVSVTGAAPDTTAPTLTSLSGTSTGETTATWSVTSDEAGGTIFAAARLSSDAALSTSEIENGTGNAIATDTDTTPTADNNNGGSFTGLAAGTEYVVDAFHRDAAGNDSGVVSSSAFTTDSAAVNPVITSTTFTAAATSNDEPSLTVDATYGGSDTLQIVIETAATTGGAAIETFTESFTSGTPITLTTDPAEDGNVTVLRVSVEEVNNGGADTATIESVDLTTPAAPTVVELVPSDITEASVLFTAANGVTPAFVDGSSPEITDHQNVITGTSASDITGGPEIGPNTVFGLPAIRFSSATNQFIRHGSITVSPGEKTLIAIYNGAGTADDRGYLLSNGTGDANALFRWTTYGVTGFDSGSHGTNTVPANAPTIHFLKIANTTGDTYEVTGWYYQPAVGKVAFDPVSDVWTGSVSDLFIGRFKVSGGDTVKFQGDFARADIIDRLVTPTEEEQIINWLRAQTGENIPGGTD